MNLYQVLIIHFSFKEKAILPHHRDLTMRSENIKGEEGEIRVLISTTKRQKSRVVLWKDHDFCIHYYYFFSIYKFKRDKKDHGDLKEF